MNPTITPAETIVHDTIRLPRAASPEAVGVPSAAIRAFVETLEAAHFSYHSFLVMKGGKVAAECYRFPFANDTPHILYSVSKSVTSCAVGIAIEEGYFDLDTAVADVFPEFVPEKDYERFTRITVRHLLSMTAGKQTSVLTDKTRGEWIRRYAECGWYAEPGRKFNYINENIFMLCAIIHRMTGQSVSEFLTPRMWEPLGIRTPYWETDENGTESGGWGLFLTPESFAKFALMLSQKGMFGGRQIVPRAYLEQATLPQAETDDKSPTGRPYYGYCFWLYDENEYLCVGMYGQTAYIRKDSDLCVVVQSGVAASAEPMYDAIRALADRVLHPTGSEVPEDLTEFLGSRPMDVLPQATLRSPLEETLQNKVIRFRKPVVTNLLGFPPSVLPAPAVYMTKDRAGNTDRFQFDFRADHAVFQWREGDEVCCVRLGLDGAYRRSRVTLAGTRYTICGAANWQDENTLQIWLRPLESFCIRYLTLHFDGKKVTVSADSDPRLAEILADVGFMIRQMFRTKKGKELGIKAFDSLNTVAQPTLHGVLLNKKY